MPRIPRAHTRPGVVVEIVNRTVQGRHLLKPGPELNPLIVGALAKAQKGRAVEIYCGAFLSTHFHLLCGFGSVKDQADFMRDFTRKLSVEVGRLYDWPGTTFPRRYRPTEVSEEAAAQVSRVRYCLGNGCKEGLVASPLDWPGVRFAEAMVSGEALRGIWIDRTGYSRAVSRGQRVTLEDFTEELQLNLAPLPCWKHLDRSARRDLVLGLIREIEEETAAGHKSEKTSPCGVEAVLSMDPHERSGPLESTPKPWCHAVSKEVRRKMRDALSVIVSAYREAADRLKEGDFGVSFPENTFPPARPFVEPLSWDRLEPG